MFRKNENFMAAELVDPKTTYNPSRKRIEILDVLRGFALLGIFLTHIYAINMKNGYQYPAKVASLINIFYVNFLFGKFYTIFSFLFGLSFYIQLKSAEIRREKFTNKFAWRLTILFMIGAMHALLYKGDILQEYALLGFLLILFRKWSKKYLLLLSIIILGLSVLIPLLNFKITVSENLGVFTEMFAGELFRKIDWYLLSEGQLYVVAALLVFGFYAGKQKLLESTNIKVFNKTLLYSGLLCLSVTLILGGLYLTGAKQNYNPELINPLIKVLSRFQQISLSFLYVSVIVIYYQKGFSKSLSLLGKVGKIGLTIYVLQSIIIHFFVEMIRTVDFMTAFGLSIILFAVMIAFSFYWTSKYKFGPLEWLWRSLTELKVQPLSKNSVTMDRANA